MATRSAQPPAYPTLRPSALEKPSAIEMRDGIKTSLGAWTFGAAFFALTNGAVYAAFARQVGANDQLFGILSAAMPLTGLLQLLSARVVDKKQRPKAQMICAGVVGRGLWIVAALAPMLAQWNILARNAVLPLICACLLLSGAAQAFNTPAFFAWVGGLVPGRVRPAFFARRTQVGTVAALLATLVGGAVADAWPRLETLCALLGVAGIFGVLDVAVFWRVRETMQPPVVTTPATPPVSTLKSRLLPRNFALFYPLFDRDVRVLLSFVALMSFGLGLTGPFTFLHALEHLNWSKTLTGFVLSVLPLTAIACSSRFWGSLIRQHGTRPVNRFVSMALIFVPLMWFIEGPFAPYLIAPLILLSSALFAGYDQCNQNAITTLGRRSSPATMTALFSIASGAGFALAATGGGFLAQRLHGCTWQAGVLLLNPYHVLFAISLLVRIFTAACVAPNLQETDSPSTRAVFKKVLNRTPTKERRKQM